MGTPLYMSREQAQGERAAVRSDLYSLGIVLYQMLTGQLPFEANTPFEVIRQHVDERPERVRRLRSDIPGAVERIVNRCLEKDPSRRYTTPREMARALADAVPGVARPESRPRMAPALPQPPPIHPVEQGQRERRERRPRRRRCSSLGSLTRTWRGSQRTRWPWVVAILAIVAAVVAIAISAGGNDLVSALIADAGMVSEAPEPTRTIQPISVVQGSVSGEPVANIPLHGTDSTSPSVVIHPTPVPMVATVAPTSTIVADLTPVPSPRSDSEYWLTSLPGQAAIDRRQ